MLIVAAVMILVLVVGFVSYPFWSGPGALQGPRKWVDADQDQERIDLEIEKEVILSSLSDLDVELVQRRLNEKDHARLKATDERRLLQVLDRLEKLQEVAKPPPQKKGRKSVPAEAVRRQWAFGVILAVFVVGGSVGAYQYLQWAQRSTFFERASVPGNGSGMPDPVQMVARLEARLRDNPNDLQGQIMAGRSYMALGRTEEASQAWGKVLELDPRNHEAHFNVGVLLLQGANDDAPTYEKALDHLNTALVKVPDEPAALWYQGIALVHLNRFIEADQSWTKAYRSLDPGSEDAQIVKQALQSLRAGNIPQF